MLSVGIRTSMTLERSSPRGSGSSLLLKGLTEMVELTVDTITAKRIGLKNNWHCILSNVDCADQND